MAASGRKSQPTAIVHRKGPPGKGGVGLRSSAVALDDGAAFLNNPRPLISPRAVAPPRIPPKSGRSLSPEGTLFQKSVWHELTKIPIGQTRTYGEIANKLNSSARAVGNACRKNPIQIIIPCHRVVSAKGLGGYAGKTEGKQIKIKRWLLSHEGVQL